ncbi:MAG: autotransporter assembly complex protein TamA [Gammaproteobacteria bacterium]|nr:autotransporter assembly complex protein TamA [Gammaproteobacteria bacterium]
MLVKAHVVAIFVLLAPTLVNADEPEISIQGLSDEQESNVRAFLSLSQENCKSPAWRINNLFTKANNEIAKALRALGYYQPTTEKKLTFADDCWQAHFEIKRGKPVRVGRFNVQVQGEAQQQPIFQKLLSRLPIKQGDVLKHALYEKIKQDLRSVSLEYGYLDHQLVKKSIIVKPEQYQAEIELILDSGPRHRFGKINIDQDILNPTFVQRYVSIDDNEYYSNKQLVKTYNALADSQYFSAVELKPQMDAIENNTVPIDIILTPQKTHDFSVGAGYDTDIGPLGSFSYQNRRLNRNGHHLALNLQISPVLSSAEGHYIIPFTEPRTDHVAFGLGYKYEKPNTFESESALLSVQYQHFYQTGWQQNLFVKFIHEKFTISDESQKTTLLVPGARWLYTQSNHALRPTQGYHLDLSVSAAPEVLFSDVAFVQASAVGKLITSLPWSARLIARTNLGATLTSDFERLPPSQRFYTGGTETIRGYNYKELGPRDSQGTVIGGRMLAVASIEYEQFITESWGVAAFFDAGNAFEWNQFKLKRGAGIGIRWLSPIGPIRLDFAVPLNDSNDSFQIHFAAGAQL